MKERNVNDVVRFMCCDNQLREAVITNDYNNNTFDVAYVSDVSATELNIVTEHYIDSSQFFGPSIQKDTILPFHLYDLVKYQVDENSFYLAHISRLGLFDHVDLVLGDQCINNEWKVDENSLNGNGTVAKVANHVSVSQIQWLSHAENVRSDILYRHGFHKSQLGLISYQDSYTTADSFRKKEQNSYGNYSNDPYLNGSNSSDSIQTGNYYDNSFSDMGQSQSQNPYANMEYSSSDSGAENYGNQATYMDNSYIDAQNNYDGYMDGNQYIDTNQYIGAQYGTPIELQQKKKKSTKGTFWAFACCFLAIIGFFLYISLHDSNESSAHSNGSTNSTGYQSNTGSLGGTNGNSSFGNGSGNTVGNDSNADVDYATVFSKPTRVFLTTLFEEEASEITKEQLDSITALMVTSYRNSDDFEKIIFEYQYAINGGELQLITFEDTDHFKDKDISYFSNLTMLKAGLDDLDSPLDLPNLTVLKTDSSVSVVKEKIVNYEQLTSLTLYSRMKPDKINDLSEFVNLEELSFSVDSSDTIEIDGILGLSHLKSLKMESSEGAFQYSDMACLTEIESLYIKSKEMKSVEFVLSMPKLKSLKLERCDILDYSPLMNLPLTELALIDNEKVEDYSFLGTLTSLQSLIVDSTGEIALSNDLTEVTYLEVSGFRDISFVKHLPNLQVAIVGTAGNISNISSEVDIVNFTNCTQLKSLDLYYVCSYDKIEKLMDLPSLESLNIYKCDLALDFSKLSGQSTLTNLKITDSDFFKNVQIYYDGVFTNIYYDDVNLCDQLSDLGKYPNIQNLSIIKQDVSDVSGLNCLTNLKYLDLSDNFVTNLEGISGLSNLETVVVTNNAITSTDPASVFNHPVNVVN